MKFYGVARLVVTRVSSCCPVGAARRRFIAAVALGRPDDVTIRVPKTEDVRESQERVTFWIPKATYGRPGKAGD